jgi:hypothetical protein
LWNIVWKTVWSVSVVDLNVPVGTPHRLDASASHRQSVTKPIAALVSRNSQSVHIDADALTELDVVDAPAKAPPNSSGIIIDWMPAL